MRKRYAIIITLVLLFVVIFSATAFLQGKIITIAQDAAATVQENGVAGVAVFTLLAAASVMLGPFTSTPLIPLAISIWTPETTLLFLLVGWLIGNSIAYALGRYIGYPVVRTFIEKEKLDQWIDILSNHVGVGMLLLFRIASPSETGYVFGIMRYDLGRYFIITFLGELPFALLAVYTGHALITTRWWMLAGLGALWVAIIYWSLNIFRRRLRQIKDKETASPGAG
jgi:uncharacterized membrane protein YdjX (TVP38/TMEM64 family)